MNFLALAQAPDLARAAREELWALDAKPGGEEAEEATHAAEVERQRAAILSIDADARAESAVNKVRPRREQGARGAGNESGPEACRRGTLGVEPTPRGGGGCERSSRGPGSKQERLASQAAPRSSSY